MYASVEYGRYNYNIKNDIVLVKHNTKYYDLISKMRLSNFLKMICKMMLEGIVLK